MRKTGICLGWLVVPAILLAQDTKVLGDAIDHFKGTADEVRKNNPVLAVGTGEGVKSMMKFVTGRRSGGKGPVSVELPKEQQEELERRQKARERAEQLAKAGPRRVAPPKPKESPLPAITPLAMQAILHPPQRPTITVIEEPLLKSIAEGQDRATVLARLGKPSSTSAVMGMEGGPREVLTYHLAPNRPIAVQLLGGRVTGITGME